MTATQPLDVKQLKNLFWQTFGDHDQGSDAMGAGDGIRAFFAPGRVNLIGEHTDYTGGYVFPAALTYGTWALIRKRKDGRYRFASTDFAGMVVCHGSDVVYKEEDGWGNYPKGVLKEWLSYARQKVDDSDSVANLLTGVDVLYAGNIPYGAGLSSSAAVELVTAVALTSLASLTIPMIDLVTLAQRAENDFVGVNCGIMDQFAVGMGKKDHAIMLKCDTMDYDYVPFKAPGYRLVITNTNKRRGLTDSKYNERRNECETGLRQVKQHLPHMQSLGDLRDTEWHHIRDRVPVGVIRNRVEHVVSENERVLAAVACLQNNDLQAFGRLMNESHESLRDLFDVTGTELDTLFEAARQIDGCIGTRMTGAGFGGCTISLVKKGDIDRFKRVVAETYTSKTGLTPEFYTCDIGDGAREIALK